MKQITYTIQDHNYGERKRKMNKQKYIIEMIEEKFKNSTSLTVGEYELIVRAWETLHNKHDKALFVQAKREVEQEEKEEPMHEDNSMRKSAYAHIMYRLQRVSESEEYLCPRDLAKEIRERFPTVKQPHSFINGFLHRFMGEGKLHKIHKGFYKGVKK